MNIKYLWVHCVYLYFYLLRLWFNGGKHLNPKSYKTPKTYENNIFRVYNYLLGNPRSRQVPCHLSEQWAFHIQPIISVQGVEPPKLYGSIRHRYGLSIFRHSPLKSTMDCPNFGLFKVIVIPTSGTISIYGNSL